MKKQPYRIFSKFRRTKVGNAIRVEGMVENIHPRQLILVLYFTIHVKKKAAETFKKPKNLSIYIDKVFGEEAVYKALRESFSKRLFNKNCIVTFAYNHNVRQLTWQHKSRRPNYVMNLMFNVPDNVDNLEPFFYEMSTKVLDLDIFKNSEYIEFVVPNATDN